MAPDDPQEMAEAIERLIADDAFRCRLAENGRQKFLQNFEFEPFYARIMATYSSVLRFVKPSIVRQFIILRQVS